MRGFILWLLFFTVLYNNVCTEEPCAVDILFVLDASSSVQGDFDKLKDFVVEMAKLLVISPDGHRVALLEFSGDRTKWPEFPLGFVNSTDEFVRVLQNIPNLRGTTFLGKALRKAQDILQTRNKNIKTLLFVVTDGFSYDDVEAVAKEINSLDNVVTIAAGVPPTVNKEDLKIVAGGVDELVITQPDVLNKAKAVLSKYLFKCDIRLTRAPKPPPVTTTTAKSTTTILTTTQSTTTVTTSFLSGCELDVLLVVDFSSSVNPIIGEYKTMNQQLVEKLKVGKFYTRVSMLQYASKFRTEITFPFNRTFEKEGVLKQIANTEYTGGTTNTQAALELAAKSFGQENGARPGLAKQVAVVFSDGFSQYDPASAAKILRDKGITVYAASSKEPSVNNNNNDELQSIAGDDARVFVGQNVFAKLVDEISRISNTCSRL